jgi:hypothetical protein
MPAKIPRMTPVKDRFGLYPPDPPPDPTQKIVPPWLGFGTVALVLAALVILYACFK